MASAISARVVVTSGAAVVVVLAAAGRAWRRLVAPSTALVGAAELLDGDLRGADRAVVVDGVVGGVVDGVVDGVVGGVVGVTVVAVVVEALRRTDGLLLVAAAAAARRLLLLLLCPLLPLLSLSLFLEIAATISPCRSNPPCPALPTRVGPAKQRSSPELPDRGSNPRPATSPRLNFVLLTSSRFAPGRAGFGRK